MSKSFSPFFLSTCLFSLSLVCADSGLTEEEALAAFPVLQTSSISVESAKTPADLFPSNSETSLFAKEPLFPSHANPETPKAVAPKAQEVSVKPFTGKIKGRKVRMRLKADVESRIVREMHKNDLLLVVGEKGDFWVVEAPANTKAYVFRSFVLDNVIEGNHVNVRLEPSLDAPIIAHMNAGDEVQNPIISAINPKWLEITPPSSTHFYVAKDYVEYAGGPEVKIAHEKREKTAEQLLDSSLLLSKTEMKKKFEEIDFDRVVKGYHTVINDFSEFAEFVEPAKEALASFQEEYLQKRISYLDAKKEEEALAQKTKGVKYSLSDENSNTLISSQITDKMHTWDPIEEALYLSWSNINDNKSLGNYYEEQKLAAVEISGFLEPYTTPVKNRPGDFIVRENDVPVAYVYSTQVNLQSLVGTHVKLTAAPRPNNNFAFPAYYVLTAE